jgi:plasmid stabilization system protein ParE
MNHYRVSDTARADLDEIWDYIARDNIDAADRLIHAIVSRFRMLAIQPEAGRSRKELAVR